MDMELVDKAQEINNDIAIEDNVQSTATRVDLGKDQRPDIVKTEEDVIKKDPAEPKATEITFDERRGDEEEAQAPKFTPNFKFRAGQKEYEIDEWARGAIKDEQTNKLVKDFFEKAYGIEHVKEHRDRLQSTNENLSREIENFNQNLRGLSQDVQKGHFEDFFQKLDIPEQRIIQWAANRVKYYELDPAQKHLIESERAARHQNQQLSQERSQYEAEAQAAMVQLRGQQLDWELSKPEVAEAVAKYDSLRGPGAFRMEVIQRGALKNQLEGVDVLPTDLVRETLDALNLRTQQGAIGPTVIPAGNSGVVPMPQQKPVLPNVKATGGSPTARVPKSVDELREIARKRAAAEG